MKFPPWFREAIQKRLDNVSDLIENHSELSRIRENERKAFERLFAGMDIGRMPEFAGWEDCQHLKQAIMNEWLYLQGLKDGIQLASALSSHLHPFDDQGFANIDSRQPDARAADSGGPTHGSQN
ncbi:hypothetical protein [Paenibacillus naphthalenovorans]|uniref:hypothetical protein n=1 Tax=Paenibacillus naphthalenovorans TaxID=162209 RepID=UPI003D2B1960